MTLAFGTGFGGTTTTAPAFGTGTGFSFGNPSTSTAGSTGFGFGFGTPTTTTAATGFGFGTSSTPSTGFSFGGGAATAPTTTTSLFSFGGFGTTSTAPTFSFGNIGASTSTTPSGFSFGQPSTFGGTGGFGTGFGSTAGIGTSAATPQTGGTGTPVIDNNLSNIIVAVSSPMIYKDERDSIIAKWNQLQAFSGTGKGYFSPNAPPIEFTPDNPLCRFKAVGYSCIPQAKPEDGLVSLIYNKKEEEIRAQQQQIIDSLKACFGNKPNINVCVDAVKSFPEEKSEVIIYLVEQSPTGATHRILPSEVCMYLEQPNVKPNLGNLGIVNVYPKTGLTKEQMQHYLDNPPAGIDPKIWQQAKADNPNPEKLIPVPLIGFADLHHRMKCQEYETRQHQERLDLIADDIAELNRRHTTTAAKVSENKRKLLELQHRILRMLVQQEITRKMGFSIQADEEQLRIKLEAIQAELSAPTQFKGHLKELISQIRMQNYQGSFSGDGERYSMDEASKEKIKEHLRLQQEGIAHLISIIKEDMMDLKVIEEISRDMIEKR